MDGRELLRAMILAGGLAACEVVPGPPPEPAATGPPDAAADRPEVVEPGGAPASQSPIDWTVAGDCLERLEILRAAAAQGALAPDQRTGIAVAVQDDGSERFWPTARPSFVSADLPLEIRASARSSTLEPCAIEIGRPRDLEVERQTVAREQVASAYQTGARSERNPEYELAKARVEQLERQAKQRGPGIISVGDPMLDLIGTIVGGVLSGFSEYGEERDLEEALAELAQTPRTLEHPTYRPYRFERTVVRASKRAVVPVTLHDRARGRSWRTELRQHEFREFQILDGLDPRDRDYEQHHAASITPWDLDQWAERPPELRLSSVVAGLAAADEGADRTQVAAGDADFGSLVPPRAGDPSDDLRRVKGAAPMPAAFTPSAVEGSGSRGREAVRPDGDLRSASVVRVAAGGRTGTGFYVRPDLVLTTQRLAGDAMLIDLTTAAGDKVAGLLAASDPGRGLALVQIPKPGLPVTLGAGSFNGMTLEVPNGRRTLPVVPVNRAGAMLHVRTSRPVPDDLMGAPVFLDQAVVGVLSSRGEAPGELLVVRASEILDFLGRYAGPSSAAR